jgi:hypothetical protein
MAKQIREMEQKVILTSPFDPHRNSYYT